MTRLGRASAFLAVFAGDYAILMLINGQLTDFDVSAGVCAVALLGAALFEYVVRLSRKTLADVRAAVWEPRDRETSTMSPYPQPTSCGGADKVRKYWTAASSVSGPAAFPAGWRTGIARPAPGPTPTSGGQRKPPLRRPRSTATSTTSL